MSTQDNSRTLLHTVEGPKGKAELYEVISSGQSQPQYEVDFGGSTISFKSMGEAYIEAGSLSGTPT